MSIYRIRKDRDNPYVMVNKHFIQDSRLSYKAKGILLYLLSRPDDWQVYETEIARHAKDGRDSVRAGIKELLEAGYIKRGQRRQERGKFAGYEYEVFEYPHGEVLHSHRVGFSDNGKSDNGKPDTTNIMNKLSNEETNNIYINLPIDDDFLSAYAEYYEYYLGKQHPRVSEQQLWRIRQSLAELKASAVTLEEWSVAVNEHFRRLPESNNGNILAFLTASYRYFDVDLRDVI